MLWVSFAFKVEQEIIDLRPLFTKCFRNLNFPLSAALAVSHRYLYDVFIFIHFKIVSNIPFEFFVDRGLYKSMSFSFQIWFFGGISIIIIDF